MPKKYRSDISRTMHKTITGLHKIGVVDKTTMREFDRMCLTKTEALTADEIRAIREKAGVSQAVFAEHLGITTGLVSKWECGEKNPSRMALKLLALVKAKGLDVIA
jgi:putative transcriptional regulator